MEIVQHYIELLTQVGEEEFRARHRYPFLLYPEKHGSSGFSTYHTRMAGRGGSANLGSTSREMRTFCVLTPPQSGAASKKLLVGRAPEREFNIDHSTVSKRHAFILWEDEKQAWQLGDAGSTNGTFLNGQAVEAGEPVYLHDSNVVSFGDCDYLFFSPEGFIGLLKRLQADKG
jgi:hypothetical protein